MNSEYGKKSPQDLKDQARRQMLMAEKAEPCVTVTESNWKALVAAQHTEIEMLKNILDALGLLATEEELVNHMNDQMTLLEQYSKESERNTRDFQREMSVTSTNLQKDLKRAAQDSELSMSTAAKDIISQAGRMSEDFSRHLSSEKESLTTATKRLMLISLTPAAIQIIMMIISAIWSLISRIHEGTQEASAERQSGDGRNVRLFMIFMKKNTISLALIGNL